MQKTKPAVRRPPDDAVYDGVPGTPVSCTPVIMGRKPRASAAVTRRPPPRRPSAR